MTELLIFIFYFIRLAIPVFIIGFGIYLSTLLVKALKLYIHSKEGRPEYSTVKKTLGETLKSHRERCRMTQEFVANSLQVSRQAVSKWETGASDPNTSNLLALAKLYDISAEELLRNIQY